ncbi:MAG: hypothetical protein HFG29_08360 [Eubacterium sp.]|nr:hypothetical protein [Eubacterium sp.]
MKQTTMFRSLLTFFLSICMTISALDIQLNADILRTSQPLGMNVAKNSRLNIPNSTGDALKLVDGDENTGWQAPMNQPSPTDALYDPQEWNFQFDSVYTIDTINLVWETSCGKTYDVYVSETGKEGSWVKVISETNGKAGKNRYTFTPVDAKYIKLDLKYRALNYGYYLYEIEVFTIGSTEDKTTDNIALNAVASASSFDGTNTADKAIDGNKNSIWQTPKQGTNEERANQFIQLKWNTPQQFDTVKVLWSGGYMAGYKLQVSNDGGTWEDVAYISDGKSNEYKVIKLERPVTKAYLRLQGTIYGNYCFEVKELEVYNESSIIAENMYLSRDNIKLDIIENGVSKEQLYAAINPSNTANKTIIWTSSNNNVATVDENGLVIAKSVGKAVITAVSQSNPNVKKTCNVTVAKGVDAPQLSVSLTENKDGVIVKWNAVDNAQKYVLQRSLVDKEKVEVYSGKGTSFVDANLDCNTYIYYLVAKAQDGDYICDSTVVTSERITVPVRVEDVEIHDTTMDIFVRENSYVNAYVTPNNATDTRVTWESSDSSIATVNSNGQVTAVKEGMAIITATSVDNPKAKDHIYINCKPVLMTKLILDKASDIVEPGAEVKLTETIYPQNTTYKSLVWKSSDDSVATVDGNGVVRAVAPGTAKITVHSQKQPEIKSEYQIIVKVNVTKITLNKTVLNLQPGTAETLSAVVYPSNATNKKYNWISSNPNIADVEVNGRVVAFQEGTAIITAISEDGKYTAKCSVYIKNVPTFKKPAKVVIKSLKKSKNKVTLKWKKISDAKGYQIYLKKGKGKFKRIKTIKNPKKIKFMKKKMKKGIQYTFKVRAYKLNGKKKVFGTFSKVKKIKL